MDPRFQQGADTVRHALSKMNCPSLDSGTTNNSTSEFRTGCPALLALLETIHKNQQRDSGHGAGEKGCLAIISGVSLPQPIRR
jgi:hypothetical protein